MKNGKYGERMRHKKLSKWRKRMTVHKGEMKTQEGEIKCEGKNIKGDYGGKTKGTNKEGERLRGEG